jgi:hypothetical protein
LEKIDDPGPRIQFIKITTNRWTANLLFKGEFLGKVKFRKGILDGDNIITEVIF